jgi:hypothetical protein
MVSERIGMTTDADGTGTAALLAALRGARAMAITRGADGARRLTRSALTLAGVAEGTAVR